MTDPHADEPLDEEQHAAVIATEKAIAVLAGPGSGKTRTLAHRARHLLLEDSDSRALLLTFTNKAAAEMKSRALKVGNLAADRIEAGTFHAFGARVLRGHGHLVGIERDFVILDDDERTALAAEVAADAGVPHREELWSRRRLRRENVSAPVAAFGEAFEGAKRAEGVVDFDDLVVYTATLLEEKENLAAAYGSRFSHVLVDEFQDTNAVHFAVVQALCPHVRTMSVFADDDQAIMRFAGADAANIQRFVDELEAREFPLTCNYRSREEIVRRANLLIAADPRASGRRMRAEKPDGSVDVQRYASDQHEAQAVADAVAELVLDDKVSAGSIAVLVRIGFHADDVVRAIQNHDVPVTDWRSVQQLPRERRIFKTCMSVVRPRLTTAQATKLSELLRVDVTDERDTHALLEAHAGNAVADELLALRAQAFDEPQPSLVAAFAQRAIAAHDPVLAEPAQALVDAVEDFERFDPNFSLEHLLVELALKAGGRAPTEGGGVKIASLHGTKGLQWPIVYLVGLDEGRLPFYRSVQEGTVDEERRACFVGVCRAEDRLVLTHARRVGGYGQEPSRFLEEMELL